MGLLLAISAVKAVLLEALHRSGKLAGAPVHAGGMRFQMLLPSR